MRKYNPEIHTPRTGWDAISLEMAREEGKELFVDENGEVWTADKKHFAGKIRKEEGKRIHARLRNRVFPPDRRTGSTKGTIWNPEMGNT